MKVGQYRYDVFSFEKSGFKRLAIVEELTRNFIGSFFLACPVSIHKTPSLIDGNMKTTDQQTTTRQYGDWYAGC